MSSFFSSVSYGLIRPVLCSDKSRQQSSIIKCCFSEVSEMHVGRIWFDVADRLVSCFVGYARRKQRFHSSGTACLEVSRIPFNCIRGE